MTKYRLKDQELQKKLDEISNGGFTEALMSVKKPSCLVFQARNGGPAMSIMLTDQDIELFWEYNPDDWNIYPEVKPPEGVLMRVEGRNGDCIFRFSAVFKEGIWCSEDEVPEKVKELGWEIEGVKRFRPWE